MQKKMNSLPLAEALESFSAGEPAYFCIPGHRGSKGISPELVRRFGDKVFSYDRTESYGLDDLHHAEGVIRQAQEKAAELYRAQHTRFLVNGTTCGNEALILSIAGEGDEIIIARNAHKSVTAGLVLSGARPVWVMPEYDEEWGFCRAPSAAEIEKKIKEHQKAKAVFIVSPTYYGTLADIEAIAEVCHKHHIPLLVDEAHGAHLYFSELFPKGALALGADAVVMSTHKTLGSLGQSSMLHVNSSRVDIDLVDKALKLVMSSSPSYVLMTSLDAAREQMETRGEEIMKNTFELSVKLRKEAEKHRGIKIFNSSCAEQILKDRTDPSRVVISAYDLGISGYKLSDMLFEDFGCALEMADERNVVAVVTSGNTEKDIERLSEALGRISAGNTESKSCNAADIFRMPLPKAVIPPREAYFSRNIEVPLWESLGRVCGQTISPYPPGIPLVVPGEIIDEEVYGILEYCRSENIKIHTDGSSNTDTIQVLERKKL